MYFYPNNTTPAVPLPLLPHTMAGHALAINGACSYIGGDCSNRAVIWTGDVSSPAALVPTDTNTLTGPTSQWHLQTVTGINDQGAFVGNGLYGQKYVAYLAIPVTLASITLSSNQQTGAGQLTGTVTIDNPAPFDMTVTLTSFLAAATFTNGAHSTSVVIPQGTTNADFLLNCASVSTKSSAYIRANYGGWDVYTKLVLVP